MTRPASPAAKLIALQSAGRCSALEAVMALHLRADGLDAGAVREHRFDAVRKWRFDWAWPDRKLALEVDGGTFSGGRHTTGPGFASDCEKLSEAAVLGWRVIRATGQQVKSGQAVAWVRRALGAAP